VEGFLKFIFEIYLFIYLFLFLDVD